MLDRIVEVFCEVDDFCKAFLPQWEAFLPQWEAFLPQWEASLLSTGGTAPRGPKPGLSTSESITLVLVFHSSGFKRLSEFACRGHNLGTEGGRRWPDGSKRASPTRFWING